MEPTAVTKQAYPNFGLNLSFAESIKSTTAISRGIDNRPPIEHYANMAALYANVIKPIFARFGRKAITSFYRCPALNKVIGGAKNSQHTTGQAVDIDCDGIPGSTNKEVFAWIRANIQFDQLIWEFGDDDGPDWIHVSYVSPEKNRGNVLRATKKGGKTIYTSM